jgi:hypothetical protein
MSRKREITIIFVTDNDGTVASVINAVSHIADDLTVTSKTIGRRSGKVAHRLERTSPGPEIVEVTERRSHEPELVYCAANPETPHRRNIDVEASLKKLGLNREKLVSQKWPRGSAQHRLKRAAAQLISEATDSIRASKTEGVGDQSRA